MILAAGQGTRMRSHRQKVLHPLAGKPLILRILQLVHDAGAAHVVVVLGHQAEQVRRSLPSSVHTVIQMPQLGTGHAVQVAAQPVRASGADQLLVHLGDNALVRPATLERLTGTPIGAELPLVLLTARLADPTGYGRVIRGADGNVDAMVEEVDATHEQRATREVWGGSMLLWTPWLWENLSRLPLRPKGEYYLTDLVNLARQQGLHVGAQLTQDEEEAHGVNDRLQLAEAEAVLRRRTLENLMRSGVSVIDPATTYVDPEVQIEPDVTIMPGCHLRGATRVARECEIGPNTYLIDTQVGAGSRVWYSVLENAVVGERASIGPFSHLRPGAVIGDAVELGNFAEVKASHIGDGSKMHHFSYVGDAELGERVNVGAGSITVNYNSETGRKSRTIVGDDASLGSDTLLVAPVEVGEGSVTAAGAVVTHDIPPGEVWLGVPARMHRRRDRMRSEHGSGP
ncbi:MAG: bifunctional UDP-N-acetylglucosamine diphosphorylase/glucosamine-1-phosphate N-acetyltransferase GlmU [Chloroflexi bacterium]|nr:bifunctional UDP-N-acetylglucosamine diphosphorylase/glucosamine-1-phosphate N-acetyltransferase GlmU [Chloroflexota bacterium]